MKLKTIFPEITENTGCKFTVWAPNASDMELILEPSSQKIQINRQKHGY